MSMLWTERGDGPEETVVNVEMAPLGFSES